jgi:hypothetical protein
MVQKANGRIDSDVTVRNSNTGSANGVNKTWAAACSSFSTSINFVFTIKTPV